MVALPNELWRHIFVLSCSDDYRFVRSIVAVSHSFRSLMLDKLYETVVFISNWTISKKLPLLLSNLEHPGTRGTIRNLWVSFPVGKEYPSRDLSILLQRARDSVQHLGLVFSSAMPGFKEDYIFNPALPWPNLLHITISHTREFPTNTDTQCFGKFPKLQHIYLHGWADGEDQHFSDLPSIKTIKWVGVNDYTIYGILENFEYGLDPSNPPRANIRHRLRASFAVMIRNYSLSRPIKLSFVYDAPSPMEIAWKMRIRNITDMCDGQVSVDVAGSNARIRHFDAAHGRHHVSASNVRKLYLEWLNSDCFSHIL